MPRYPNLPELGFDRPELCPLLQDAHGIGEVLMSSRSHPDSWTHPELIGEGKEKELYLLECPARDAGSNKY